MFNMNKKKFYIEMPEDKKIQSEINQILQRGMKPKESFLAFLKTIYHQVGFKHLFADRLELLFILFTCSALFVLLFSSNGLSLINEQEIYSLIFLVSPTLFIVFALYTYSTKILNHTYDVEMACKFNVYHIIAFRMLTFSVVSILINVMTILMISVKFEDIGFLRAMMISTTALFLFSVFFLYAMMKRQTMKAVLTIIVIWTLINLILRVANNELYTDMLVNVPLFIHAIVLISSVGCYFIYLKKLIHFKHEEGAY